MISEARKIAEKKKIKEFIGTTNWVQGFRRRHNIVYRRRTKVGQKVKPDAAKDLKEFQDKMMSLIKTHQYPRTAIVNIDETGITFDMPSNDTLDVKVNF